jgi:hypothetical protein
MKRILFLALLGLVAAGAMTSCSNDDEKNDDNNNRISTISAKWEVADASSPYASFEFCNDGSYIVVNRIDASISSKSSSVRATNFLFQNPKLTKTGNGQVQAVPLASNLSPIHYGTYSINGNTITLSGFGLLEIISVTEEEFNFSFTLEKTGVAETYRANKVVLAISASSRTETFCKTWKLNKISIDETLVPENDKAFYELIYGENWKEIAIAEFENSFKGLIVLFSKAGTYLVLYDEEAGLAEWKWANKEETAIYYSWDNWQDLDYEEHIVPIIELTATSLKIVEGFYVEELVATQLNNQ